MRQDPDAVMLFAAGFGTRMHPLTQHRPKPLIEVAGKPLLDHALSLVDAAGVSRKVVNTHYLADQLTQHLSTRQDIAISHEASEILDTGGGLRQALPLLGRDPLFTMNTDAAWTGANPLAELRSAWRPDDMDALMLLVPSDRARGHDGDGDFAMGADGRLTRGAGYVYSGVQILKTDRLHDISDQVFSLNRLWDLFQSQGRLFGVEHQGGWCDVGHPAGIAVAEDMLAEAPHV